MNRNLFNVSHKPDNYYKGKREDMLQFIPQNVNRILDVGCGEGNFGLLLKNHMDVEVWGVEIYKNAADKAKEKIDKVIIGNIESDEISLPKHYFDCIVFNDVLEHLQYPWILLRKLKENLADNGYVVASIPNIRYFETIKDLVIYKKWEYVDAGILDKTHLRFFTKNSIKSMFESCGYEVNLLAGINGSKFPWKFGLLNRILLNGLDDMRYKKFVCIAQKTDD
jgi:2-polyprenyl-3-methyl-5-hydroxy-6-metoxy-1,4-benzoquinol methylase